MDSNTTLSIYTAFVRSVIDYSHAARTHLEKIDRCNKMSKDTIGALESTPNSNLYVDCCTDPKAISGTEIYINLDRQGESLT